MNSSPAPARARWSSQSSPPPLPAAVAAVPPGALTRLFDLIREIKEANAYTEAIGLDLGIVGSPDTASHPASGLRVEAVQGTGCQCVRLPFNKWGHQGVTIESRRGTGNFEQLAIDTESPYLDERPLLVATQPEVCVNTAPAIGTKAPRMAIGPMW